MNSINFQKYLNLQGLPQEQQATFLNALINLVLARMADMIGDHLTEDEVVSLEQVTMSGDQDAILGWLDEHVPNFRQGVEEVLAEESAELGQKIALLSEYSFSQGAV